MCKREKWYRVSIEKKIAIRNNNSPTHNYTVLIGELFTKKKFWEKKKKK